MALEKSALTIAGSDPSGGAGIQADLKTFHQFGVYGMSVVSLLTVQNTCELSDVRILDPGFVRAQLEAVLSDIPPQAIKTGALGSAAIIETVSERVRQMDCPLIIDPVMISKHGAKLLEDQAIRAMKEKLLPCARLITPNLYEAELLAEMTITDEAGRKEAARKIAGLGAGAVLIKGGHGMSSAVDLLYRDGSFEVFGAELLETRHTHGTGCTLSAAITAGMARGQSISEAVGRAKEFITQAIATAPGHGQGAGPLNHRVDL